MNLKCDREIPITFLSSSDNAAICISESTTMLDRIIDKLISDQYKSSSPRRSYSMGVKYESYEIPYDFWLTMISTKINFCINIWKIWIYLMKELDRSIIVFMRYICVSHQIGFIQINIILSYFSKKYKKTPDFRVFF